jgi:hypothetical protein
MKRVEVKETDNRDSSITDLRLEMIDCDFDTEESNYDDCEDFISTEGENAFCILLNQFESFIEEFNDDDLE